ncbi:MAG TPA: hypothetical protein VIB79_11190 [Candidatus Binatia bacterium]|jgi:hypothetical protein
MFDKVHPPFRGSIADNQLFDAFRRIHPLEPELELMLAVLADAVECYWKYHTSRDGVGTRLFDDAKQWLFDDDERDPFSFRNVCAALRFDPGYIRRGISMRGPLLPKQSMQQGGRLVPGKYVRRSLKGRRRRIGVSAGQPSRRK